MGRKTHSREQTLYLIKRANQSQITFNKLQGQTTEWIHADGRLLQILLATQRIKASPSWLFKSIHHSPCEWDLSGARTRTLWISVLWCSWHYRWPTVVKTAQIRDCNEILTVGGHSKKREEGFVGSHVTVYYVKALIFSFPLILQALLVPPPLPESPWLHSEPVDLTFVSAQHDSLLWLQILARSLFVQQSHSVENKCWTDTVWKEMAPGTLLYLTPPAN